MPPDPAITEYSAIGVLILLVIISWRVAVKFLDGYNERRKIREAEELAERKKDYNDRQELTARFMELVAADIEAKKELETTLKTLTASIRRQQKFCASSEERAIERHKQLIGRLDELIPR